MKSRFLILAIALLLLNIVIWFALAQRYEFHSGQGGQLMWRCNRLTGAVQCAAFQGSWSTVKDQPAWEATSPHRPEVPDWAK